MNSNGIVKHIVEWIKEYAEKNKIKGFVVGVSGGIDSAVTSTLGAKTNLPLIALEMPIHQATNQVNLSKEHIIWLKERYPNVKSECIDLSDLYDSFKKLVSEKKEIKNNTISLVNTRARIRMTSLYYFAQLNNYIVLGTGNKVEDFGIGFFTKYGDGGVDISPIADLLKSEVYFLAKELEISKNIQKAKPTDGLWNDNRTDEDQIGATYDELEWAMLYNGNYKDLNQRQKTVIDIYQKLNKINKHKMTPIPICEIPKKLK